MTTQRFTYPDNTCLSPSKLESDFQVSSSDIRYAASRRWQKKTFAIDWNGLTEATLAAAGQYKINAPFAYRIVGIDIACLDTDTDLTSATFNIDGTTVTCPRGQRKYFPLDITVPANTVKTLSCAIVTTAAVTMSNTYGNVHYVVDRYQGQDLDVWPPNLVAGQLTSAAELDALFTAYQAKANIILAATSQLGIQVFTQRPVPFPTSASDRRMWIPPVGINLHSVDSTVVAIAGRSSQITILKDVSTSVGVITTAGTGTGNIVTGTRAVIGQTQGFNPGTAADDWLVEFESLVGALVSSTTVLYWT